MAGSRIPTAIDALVTRLRSTTALDGVDVHDGPFLTSDPGPEQVYVGYDGDPEGEFQAVESSEEFIGIGAKRKRESYSITCSLLAARGDADVQKARNRAFELYNAVNTELRSDNALGIPPPVVAAIRTSGFFMEQDPSVGIQARIVFMVDVQDRI